MTVAAHDLRARLEALEAEKARRIREKLTTYERERARRHLLPYVERTHPGYQAGWFHRHLSERLEDFLRRVQAQQSPKMMIFAPPRHGKTAITSQRFPTWAMARLPGTEIVCASYAQDLADSNSRAARTIARDDEAVAIFPDIRPRKIVKRYAGDYQRADVDQVSQWRIGNGSSYKAVGVGGPLTGHGAHIGIIDDPVKDAAEARSPTKRQAVWEWYQTVFSTRIAPGGGVLVMLTRWHEDDIAGRILQQAKKADRLHEWEIVRFPAIAEEDEAHRRAGEALHEARWPLSRLLELRDTLTSAQWAALYQQRPTPAEGGRYKRAWFSETYRARPEEIAQACRAGGGEVWATTDAAKKGTAGSDFHSLQVWARFKDGRRFLLARVCDRMDYPAFERAQDALIAHFRPWLTAALIEDTANGTTYLQMRRGSHLGIPLIAFHPSSDTPGTDKSKEARSTYMERAAEAGLIHLPDSTVAPWVGDWLETVVAFPGGAHDDDVDAATQLHMRWSLAETQGASVQDLRRYLGI